MIKLNLKKVLEGVVKNTSKIDSYASGDREYSHNDLKGFFLEFGKYELLQYLVPDNNDYKSGFVKNRDDYRCYHFGPMIESLRENELTPEENKFVKNIGGLQEKIFSFDEDREFPSSDDRDRHIMGFGLDCARILGNIVEGYVNKNDPLCPESPNANSNATWESWKDYINPVKYFIARSNRRFVKDKSGIDVPGDLLGNSLLDRGQEK